MRQTTRLPIARRGFALVDVIIGGMLLAVGLAVVISLSTRSLKMQTNGEKQMVASWLADELLNMVLVEGPVNYPKLHDVNGRFEVPFDEYTFDLDINDQGIGAPFLVTAAVNWESGGGFRQIELQTLIAERRGDPEQPREPYEPVDRLDRWYGEDDNF